MDIPDNPDQAPRTAKPTHWNHLRDPKKSFACPFCGSRIELGWTKAIDGYMHVAICNRCDKGFAPSGWRLHKEQEMSREQ
jgi:transcription elongation factor Elf1